MRRRDFIKAIGGAATVWPLAARAQQSAVPKVGFINSLSPEKVASFVAAFQQGLKETGFVDGRNVAIEYRWGYGHYDRVAELAADLVRQQVAVIAATGGEPSPQATMTATRTIPIVFTANGDPVKAGLVASLNRPGGNATGITIFGAAAVTKRLQMLHELIPMATIVYLTNPTNPNAEIEMRAAQDAARSLGVQIEVMSANNDRELNVAMTTMAQRGARGMLVASDPFFFEKRNQLVSLAASFKIPAIYYLNGFVRAGGLISYGNSLPEAFRLVGVYVGRILKGEKPADLPVIQSTRFELFINRKAAHALGLTIPQTLQVAADELID